jgi:hypothetical protein
MENISTSPNNKDNKDNNNNIITNNNIIINNNINNNNNIIQSLNPNSINENSEKKIIEKISDLLSNICDENDKKHKNESNNNLMKPFISNNPSISIKDYLERLYKYCHISTSTIILTLIYIDRLCNINKFKMTYYNIHKLILSSMVVAIKYNEDSYFSMIFYAKIGGVSKTEMIYLEFYFVTLIKFNLFVKNELFNKYNDYISSKDDEEESEEPYEDENSGEISDSNNINDNENNSNNNNNNGKY